MTDQTEIITKPVKTPRDLSGIISVRGIIVFTVISTVCLMSIEGIKVEEPLYTLAGMVAAFYFGQNQKKDINNTIHKQ